MPVEYYLNLTYSCNEQCVLCAADLGHNRRLSGRGRQLTVQQIENWLHGRLPGPRDRVVLAGGEPTVHPQLLGIIELLSSTCRDIRLFTNALRLRVPLFTRAIIEAGVTRFEIALFGATARDHDGVTRIDGSFDRTLLALGVLRDLRSEYDFAIELRLLVARQSFAKNPAIVRLVHELNLPVDAISLNRLILSADAAEVGAAVSWQEARNAINLSASLTREYGFELIFRAIPFCVFDGKNAVLIRDHLVDEAMRGEASSWTTRYIDPFAAVGDDLLRQTAGTTALPGPCTRCDYLGQCRRVEDWYVNRYGEEGLRPVILS